MCVDIHVWEHMCLCMPENGGQRSTSGVCLIDAVKGKAPTARGAHRHIDSCPEGQRSCLSLHPTPPPLSAGLAGVYQHLEFYIGVESLNSGPHDCTAKTFSTKPFSEPQKIVFLTH